MNFVTKLDFEKTDKVCENHLEGIIVEANIFAKTYV